MSGLQHAFKVAYCRDLISGTVTAMKFGPNKMLAYVIMGTVEEAEATRHAVWSLQWPVDNKGTLRPRQVSHVGVHALNSTCTSRHSCTIISHDDSAGD